MRNVNLGELLDLFTNIKVGTKEAIQKIYWEEYMNIFRTICKNELQRVENFIPQPA